MSATTLPNLESKVDDTIYRRFFTAAIMVVLTAGATWGAWMLYEIGVAHDFTGVSVFQINAHGHAQIYGWVGLFIMGFAYQVFPQKWQTRLAIPSLAVAVFVAMLVGLVTKTIALAAPSTSWGASVALLGGLLEIVAIASFGLQISMTFNRSMARFDPWVGFVAASLVFFVLQACLDTWHSWTTMTAATTSQLLWYVSTYQAPLRDMQVHGVAMLIILGVNQRLLPGLYNCPVVPRRRAWLALGTLISAVIGESGLFVAYRWTGGHILAALLLIPWLMLFAGVLMIALPWKLWKPLRNSDGEIDRSGKFIRMSYAWLIVSLSMLLLLPVYLYVIHLSFSHAYYGAIRHAITVGFVSLMIMGFAAKVIPTLNGVDQRKLSQLWMPFILINTGCFLRVTLQTLTDWSPRAFSLVGISGVIEVTALAWWGIGLIRIMNRGRREIPNIAKCGDARPAVIASNHNVAQVLKWYPESLEVFARQGFSGINNPLFRRTIARGVSIAQAAAMHEVALPSLLSELNLAVAKTPGHIKRSGCKGCGC